jgi:crossover junction endodeoxyribonuclease RuvC
LTILGIDPGLSATGYGVMIDGRAVEYGTITTEVSDELPKRLQALGDGVEQVVVRTCPDACAIETLFFKAVGARSVIRSAEARGAILGILGRHGIPVTELTPATIKLTLTGSGRASKRQMGFMVRSLMGLECCVPEHATDALAAAYSLMKRFPVTTRFVE